MLAAPGMLPVATIFSGLQSKGYYPGGDVEKGWGGEKGMVIYVPITILKEMGARLASNGVILCRDKVPYTAIHAIFEQKGARDMGARIQSPSLIDEYACEKMQGEECMTASERYVTKVDVAHKSDIDVHFTFCNNLALVLQKVQNGVPTETQATELINHRTRAIIGSGPKYECSCRWCPWCQNVIPASIIRCLQCNAILVAVGRFMDQSSLGKPRSLDSEIVVVIADESMEEINVGVEPEVEEQEDGAQPAQTDEGQDDPSVEAIIDDDNLMGIDETVDEYGEKVDFAEEYLSISNDVAQEPPAICLTPKRLGRPLTSCSVTLFFNVVRFLMTISPSASLR